MINPLELAESSDSAFFRLLLLYCRDVGVKMRVETNHEQTKE